jgi:DNA repair exonuclease SbcCD ATPase subunit
MKQISYHRDNLEYNERELKMLPSKIALYINDIKDADQNIETISQKLGPNKAKEGKMEKQIADLRKKINNDITQISFLDAKYWNLRDQEDIDRNMLQNHDVVPVEQIEKEMNNAKSILDDIEKKWQEVQHDYEDMQVEPRAYIERYYQKGKETREKQYNDQLQSKNAEIKDHEEKARDYASQIKNLSKKKDAQKIEELKQKQRDEETAVRVLKEKCVQLKKKYDENEKLVKAEALDYSQEKLDEMAAFMEKSLENYHIIKSQYDAAKQNVTAMTQAYQEQMQIYQDKKQGIDQKWDKLHKEMDDMATQLEQLRAQQIEDKKKLGVLENEYNDLKTKNQKDFEKIRFLKGQKQTYEDMIKVLKEREPNIRTAIAEAKEGLRQLGEPIPGEENQLRKSDPGKVM